MCNQFWSCCFLLRKHCCNHCSTIGWRKKTGSDAYLCLQLIVPLIAVARCRLVLHVHNVEQQPPSSQHHPSTWKVYKLFTMLVTSKTFSGRKKKEYFYLEVNRHDYTDKETSDSAGPSSILLKCKGTDRGALRLQGYFTYPGALAGQAKELIAEDVLSKP